MTIYRLLAGGEPVGAAAIADAVDMAESEIENCLALWPGVFRDEDGRVVGFWGLAIAGMPHRVTIAGRELGAWCAWDPMFISLLVGPLDVSTNDPVTGEEIGYRIANGEISELSPRDAVLSFLRPDGAWDDNVMNSFCHYVNNFAGPTTAKQWTAEHPGRFAISLDDGLAIAAHHVEETFGEGLGDG